MYMYDFSKWSFHFFQNHQCMLFYSAIRFAPSIGSHELVSHPLYFLYVRYLFPKLSVFQNRSYTLFSLRPYDLFRRSESRYVCFNPLRYICRFFFRNFDFFCFLPTLIDFFIAALKNPWNTHGLNEKLQKCIWSSHSFLFAKGYFYLELFGMLQLSVKLEKSKTFSSKNHTYI